LSAPSANKFKDGAYATVFDFDLAFKKTARWPTIEPIFHCHTFRTMPSYEFGVNLVAMFDSRRLITYRNNLLLETSELIGICRHWRALVTKF
jgi:hypothetical protein